MSTDPEWLEIDSKFYLEIKPEGGYSISDKKATKLPDGVVVHYVNEDIKGQRQFIITRNASEPFADTDTFDDVKVGTLMLQYGYAYVAGQEICGEKARPNLTRIHLPIYVMTYPISILDEVPRELGINILYEKEIRKLLVTGITSNKDNNIEANPFCLEFDLYSFFDIDIDQEYCCRICKRELDKPARLVCDKCVDENMDTDSEEDNCEVLTEEFGSRLDIGPSKQTSSSVN